MTKIKELISIQSSYSAQVNLKREYGDRALNVERMSNYRPIKAHRKAFEIIAESAFRRDSKRCFILSGSYGTGKSHLSLMLANYFESFSDTPEMKSFFDNYADSESEEQEKRAEKLRGFRKQGRYLISVCDYGANKFETYILKGLKEALEREDISEGEMDSYYLQAIRKIEEWKNSDNDYFYNSLGRCLENNHQPWTVNKLKEGLAQYNKDSIEVFREVHKEVTSTEFEYNRDNYVEIISQMSNSKVIKENFKGIVIFYDEFDYQLKSQRFDLDEFQKFAQMCAASFMTNFPIIFIATTHRSFASYKNVYNAEDFMTVNDRIQEIPLITEGIEEIISAIVNPQKDSILWKENIKPNIQEFRNLANISHSMGIFNWLSAPRLERRIIENIYPMHPMATYSLLKLAEDVGSNNRSVFTFFADEKEDIGSFDWFVKNHKVINEDGALQFYTLDLLFEYFKDKLSSDNQELRTTVREYIRNFETSLRELSKQITTSGNMDLQDLLYKRILKTMAIYQIIGVNITFDALRFGLYANTENKLRELEYCLKVATKNKIIYLNETNYCYEFRRSDAIDVNGLIKEYKEEEKNLPMDLIDEIYTSIRHEHVKKTNKFMKDYYYLEARKYNFEYNEDKRLLRKFSTVKNVDSVRYYDELLNELNKDISIKQSFEGIVVYVFCENEEDVKRAKIIASKNPSERIMIAIPMEEIPIFDDIFSLKAAISIDKSEFSSQDLGMLREYIFQYDEILKNKLEKYIDSKNLIFYSKDGIELSRYSASSDDASNKLLEFIYEGKRNVRKHEELNLIHEFKERQNIALKETTEKLLDFSEELYYRTDAHSDRGDKRYFQNLLLQAGVIRSIGTSQNKTMCELEMDYTKFQRVLPALGAMIEEIKEFDYHINIVGFINNYIKEYGIGYNAAILFFAVIRRYFKDSLTIMQEAGDIGSVKISTYDELIDLLYHQSHRNAIMFYKEIYSHDYALIKQLYYLFTKQQINIKKEITVDEIYDVIKDWYEKLDYINKIKTIYKNERIERFIDVFNQIKFKNPRDFLLEEIKTIYGYDRQDLILEENVPNIINQIKQDKDIIEQGYYMVRDKIIEDTKGTFNIQENTYDGIISKLNIWYQNLSDFQRSYNNELQTPDSKQLVLFLGKSTDFEVLISEILPNGFNLGKIKDWQIDKSDLYIDKIRLGKKHIEENIFLVHPPEYQYDDMENDIEEEEVDKFKVIIKYRKYITLKIVPDKSHSKIYITSNGHDPKDETSQRVESSTIFTYSTEEDKVIRYCGVDHKGRFSNVFTIELENEDKKFEVKYIKQTPSQIGVGDIGLSFKEEPKVQVTLPKDEDSLKQCIYSIIEQTKEQYRMKDSQFINVLESLLQQLRR